MVIDAFTNPARNLGDASQAYGNTDGSPNYATAVGAYLHSGSTGGTTTTTTKTTGTTATT